MRLPGFLLAHILASPCLGREPKAKVATIIMSSPNYLACLIASKVTWDPRPSKMSRCLFVRDISLGIDLLKNDKNSLNRKVVIHAFDCITIKVVVLQSCM
jgi:hypothetical protein